MSENEIFDKGDTVPKDGDYVCSPCGFRRTFQAGETFGECTSCLAGTSEGADDFEEGTALWEPVSDTPEESSNN